MPFSLFKDLLDTFRSRSEPTNGTPPVMEEPPYPILAGLVPKRFDRLAIVFEDKGERGFKQVIIDSDLLARYNKAAAEWLDVQEAIAALPTAPRKRKPRAKAEDVECAGISPGEPTEP